MEFDLRCFLDTEVGIEEPAIRRRNLFRKLERLYAEHGLPMLRIVAEAWAQANEVAARDKITRYFCRTVKLMLIEAQMWQEDRRFGDCQTIGDILATGVFKSKAKLPLFSEDAPPPPTGDSPPGYDPVKALKQKFGLT
jgi:hypothetical protein